MDWWSLATHMMVIHVKYTFDSADERERTTGTESYTLYSGRGRTYVASEGNSGRGYVDAL